MPRKPHVHYWILPPSGDEGSASMEVVGKCKRCREKRVFKPRYKMDYRDRGLIKDPLPPRSHIGAPERYIW